MPRQILLFLHLTGAIVWVGGMFFAYFCLRPASVQVLEPAKRLPLWAASLELFLRYTAIAVVIILVSGSTMFMQLGFKAAPVGLHIKLTLGLIMSLIFVYVYAVLFPRLRGHCEVSAWPAAGATLNTIRRLVGVNLALAVFTVAAAVLAR